MRRAAAFAWVLGSALASVSLSAADYGPLCAAVKRVTAAKKDLRVAYLGASITCGERASAKDRLSYTALTNAFIGSTLQLRVEQYNACVGSAQSSLGLALLGQVILPWKPDLIFVEYGVLDGPKEAPTVPATEQILRIALGREIPVVLVAVTTREPDQTSRAWMLFLSSYYDVPIADQKRFLDRERIAYTRVSLDGTHPNDLGHQTLAQAIRQVLSPGLKLGNCPPKKPLPALYSTMDYSGLRFVPASRPGDATAPQTVFVQAAPAVVLGRSGGSMEFAFSGSALQLLFTNGKAPPEYTYQLDGGRERTVSSPVWRQHHVLESDLGEGKHRARFRFPPSEQEVVLEGFLVVGGR